MMIDYSAVETLVKEYPVVSGSVSLWALGVGSYLVKSSPRFLRRISDEYFTTSIIIDNNDTGEAIFNYRKVNEWIEKEFKDRLRHMQVSGQIFDETYGGYGIIPAEGTLYKWISGRLFRFRRTTEKKENGNNLISIRISTYGRNNKPIMNWFETTRYKDPARSKVVYIYSPLDKVWQGKGDIGYRPIESVIIADSIRDEVTKTITKFLSSEEWYSSKGIPYKLVIVLEGPPGTGKTSFIKSLAKSFDKNLAIVNLSAMKSDNDLDSMYVPSESFIAIEDFDSCSSTKSRTDSESTDKGFGVTLSGLLNYLDGLSPRRGEVIFMTTNHIEKIDPAILRKGRTDKIYHLGPVGDTLIKRYVNFMYADYKIPAGVKFPDNIGCNVQAAFFDSDGDPDKMVKILEEVKND